MKNSMLLLGAVFLLLLAAAAAIRVFKGKLSEKDYTNLSQRVRSWMVIVLLLAGALLHRTATIVLLALVAFLGLKEYFSIIDLRAKDRGVLLLLYLSIPVEFYLIHIEWYVMFLIFVPVYIFLLLAVMITLEQDVDGILKSSGVLYWGIMINVYAVGHLAYLVNVDLPQFGVQGAGLMVYLIFLTELNDVLQYLFGRAFGRRKIAPAVSPNKTVAGFLGGFFCTPAVAVPVGLFLLRGMPVWLFLLTGLVVGTLGFCGDIFLSAIKRDMHVKDTSQFIPGHGGVLDRVDSLILVSPLFFHIVAFLYKIL